MEQTGSGAAPINGAAPDFFFLAYAGGRLAARRSQSHRTRSPAGPTAMKRLWTAPSTGRSAGLRTA